ncbi:hypothetical protein ABIB51_002413 [Arthrobacter sp. UYCu712]
MLLLHRSMEREHVIAGIAAALQVGAVTADVVAVEARRCAVEDIIGRPRDNRHPGAKEEIVEHRIVSLTQRRLADPAAVIAGLPPDRRQLPSVAGYDRLLRLPAPNIPTPPSKEQVS